MDTGEGSTSKKHKSRNINKSEKKKKEKATPRHPFRDELQKILEPYLLGGEQIVHSAKVARKHIIKGIINATQLPEEQLGGGYIPGVLLITNYRLIFLSNATLQSESFLSFFKDKRKSQRMQWMEVRAVF